MPEDARKLTCEEFQSQTPELLASGADIEDHPHVKACAVCGQLLQDIETIGEAARHLSFRTDDWSEST